MQHRYLRRLTCNSDYTGLHRILHEMCALEADYLPKLRHMPTLSEMKERH